MSIQSHLLFFFLLWAPGLQLLLSTCTDFVMTVAFVDNPNSGAPVDDSCVFFQCDEASLAVRTASLPQYNALHSLAVVWSLRPSTVSIKQTKLSVWKQADRAVACKMGHRLGMCRV